MFNGGQLKVLDYARHVGASGYFQPRLYTTTGIDTSYDPALCADDIPRTDSLDGSDAFFLAGLDWSVLDNAGVDIGGRPVVNLIQGFSHTTPGDPRYEYLSRPALRICVSPQLATALADTGRVNGPIVTIENGLDLDALRAARTNAHFAVAIAGLKNAPLALEIEARLQECGIETIAQTQGLPHDAFLALLASASVAVVLPHETEGFFLPALEAMVLGCAVVAPDCIGNRSFCVDHRTALVPEYSADAIVQAISLLLSDALVTRRILAGAAAIVERYSLSGERDKFYRALDIFLDAP